MHFNKCHISNVFVEKSLFSDRFDRIYYTGGGDSGFHFIDCDLKEVNIVESIFRTTLRFSGANFKALIIDKCKFYIAPCLLQANEIDSTQKITLPVRKDFIQINKPKIKMIDLLKAIKNGSPLFQEKSKPLLHNFRAVLRKHKREVEIYSNFKEGEYKKFRAIHKLAKGNGWYAEQDNYNYLMRMTIEQTNQTGLFNTTISKIYRWLSSYGQSTIKPFAWLIFLMLFFSFIYALLDSTAFSPVQKYLQEALLPGAILSLNQIIKPFQLILFDESSSLIKSLIGLLESIISSTLIALILIALRWHFKRD